MSNYLDILIDNNIAKNFANPMDSHYKELVQWLLDEGSLAVCNYLLSEYNRTSQESTSRTNICLVVNLHTTTGRINKIDNKKLKAFGIPKATRKRLLLHEKDIPLLKTVLLSDRKLALTRERTLEASINNYPRGNATAARRPQDLMYRRAKA